MAEGKFCVAELHLKLPLRLSGAERMADKNNAAKLVVNPNRGQPSRLGGTESSKQNADHEAGRRYRI